jgi:hypothetical protein
MQPYFAYGMNMHLAHMRQTAPQAVPLGAGALEGFRFHLASHGYATIAPAPHQSLPGAVFLLSPEDERALDAFEGVEEGLYAKHHLPVTLTASGETLDCLVYIAPAAPPAPAARPGYIEIILQGAREHALPETHLAFLESFLPR